MTFHSPCTILISIKQKKANLKDFAAIDFETANRYPSSVCSVGLVIVRDGEIADSFYSLIRPRPNYYSPRNIEVHGLTKDATQAAPPFPEVWEKAAALIGELPLVAHFSQFDEGCLKAAFAAYGMEYPGYAFYCTCRASRAVLGGKLPDHQLPTEPRTAAIIWKTITMRLRTRDRAAPPATGRQASSERVRRLQSSYYIGRSLILWKRQMAGGNLS